MHCLYDLVNGWRESARHRISFSQDSTQFAAGFGNGKALVVSVVGQTVEWKYLEIVVTDPRAVMVYNVVDDNKERLEFRDRVVKLNVGFGYLVAISTTQCYIYR